MIGKLFNKYTYLCVLILFLMVIPYVAFGASPVISNFKITNYLIPGQAFNVSVNIKNAVSAEMVVEDDGGANIDTVQLKKKDSVWSGNWTLPTDLTKRYILKIKATNADGTTVGSVLNESLAYVTCSKAVCTSSNFQCTPKLFYKDSDGDGHGVSTGANSISACNAPAGYTMSNKDCDDDDKNRFFGNKEVCGDGIDQDCSGTDISCVGLGSGTITSTPSPCWDNDGDGYGAMGSSDCAIDCNDADVRIHIGAFENCDGVDNNCNVLVDETCSCVSNTTQSCGTNTGECVAGVQTCTAGAWGTCVGQVQPVAEGCDGFDNNCNGTNDEGVLTTYYQNIDGDLYGNSSNKIEACSQPASYITTPNDCNDTNNTINPLASEVCDGVDNDCDNITDEGCSCVNETTKTCGISTGECATGTQTCNNGSWSTCAGEITPVLEKCDGLDNNCDGTTDEGCDFDNDDHCGCGQSFTYASDLSSVCPKTNTTDNFWWTTTCDCKDSNGQINPTKTEVCDGVDNNCDNIVDEGCLCTNGASQACGVDTGSCSYGTQLCSAGSWGACLGSISPTTEVCDNQDNDCDGTVDEGVKNTYYKDVDRDTYGAPSDTVSACAKPTNYVTNSTDCNDLNSFVNPGKPEKCDGTIDDDCDGDVDEGCLCVNGATTPCGATDTGECSYGTKTCNLGAWGACVGEVVTATEVCDNKDNDCDGSVDENVKNTYYKDADTDTYGSSTNTVEACSPPLTYSSRSGDCNDSDKFVYPGANENCDGTIDHNCNGVSDTAECACTNGATTSCGTDTGECATGLKTCSLGLWGNCTGAVSATAETCDGKDNNCDGTADEGVANTYYSDGDGDSFGPKVGATTTTACSLPAGKSNNTNDCDDANNMINPSIREVCGDSKDNDCDGQTDEYCVCTNGATTDCGVSSVGECTLGTKTCVNGSWGGCSSHISPTAEVCDTKDNDCDGSIDEGVCTQTSTGAVYVQSPIFGSTFIREPFLTEIPIKVLAKGYSYIDYTITSPIATTISSRLYDDGVYGDAVAGDKIFSRSYYLNSDLSIYPNGIYSIKISGLWGTEIKTFDNIITFTVADETEECIAVERNGSFADKLDIVFVPDGYVTISDLQTFAQRVDTTLEEFYKITPFKEKRNKINISRIDKDINTMCAYPASGSCNPSTIMSRAVSCSFDQVVVLKNSSSLNGPLGFAWVDSGVSVTASAGRTPLAVARTTAHELGHAFASLYDEYIGGSGAGGTVNPYRVNCDDKAGCPRWSSITGTECVAGCYYSNWYKSITGGLMSGSGSPGGFGIVNINKINSLLDLYN
jgi:hypothetical protein